MDRVLAALVLLVPGLYLAFLALLALPYVQTHVLYLHAVRWPLFANLSDPVRYGLPASRSLNVQIQTRDGLLIGAWLILPPAPAIAPDSHAPPGYRVVHASLAAHPTILVLHGNAATRAMQFRVQIAVTYAARCSANVLAIDYRGFGDSQGTPSELGLVADARAAWDWVVARGAQPHNVVLVGMSLGTGVAAALAAQLASEDVHPRGIVLLAPFISIDALLHDFYIFGFIPLLQPLHFLPSLQKWVKRFLRTHFNTSAALPHIKSRILLAHARKDAEIPNSHSRKLFEQMLEDRLPAVPAAPRLLVGLRDYDWSAHRAAVEQRRSQRDALVHVQNIPGFGQVQRATRPDGYGDVVYVDAMWGGHDTVGLQDSLVDLVERLLFH